MHPSQRIKIIDRKTISVTVTSGGAVVRLLATGTEGPALKTQHVHGIFQKLPVSLSSAIGQGATFTF